MKAVLTGAEGNLGSHILGRAVFECLPVSRSGWEDSNCIPVAECQALIHCAYDLKNDLNVFPDRVIESNIVSTGKALRLCREKRIPRMIFISSCSVYGDSSNSAEDKPCSPVTMNGFTKLFNEELIKSFCEANAIDYLILRVFNSYGGDDQFSVVQKLISCAKHKAAPSRFSTKGLPRGISSMSMTWRRSYAPSLKCRLAGKSSMWAQDVRCGLSIC